MQDKIEGALLTAVVGYVLTGGFPILAVVSRILHEPNMSISEEGLDLQTSKDKQIIAARSFCLAVARDYWKSVQKKTGIKWHMRAFKGVTTSLTPELKAKAFKTTQQLNELEPEYAGYELAIQYMKLLPKEYREKYGVFYTPINVVKEMLVEAKRSGIDLKTAKIIDASSGGSAFLAPLCREMVRVGLSDQQIIKDIETRLTGVELDPFAAWLSQLLIDCELASLAPKAIKPKPIVLNANALTLSPTFFGKYDYVIGNPPYGKLSPQDIPEGRYDDIVFGTPNLYQLFYKLSFLLAKSDGFIHLITPTGFIGGNYFKALRNYINKHGSAVSFSFFHRRKNVFAGVQQELVISLFKKGVTDPRTNIYSILGNQKEDLILSRVGSVLLTNKAPWVLPKTQEELAVSELFLTCPAVLSDIGYEVHTGYVVPHRSRDRLSNIKRKGSRPMVWAEAIQDDGFKLDVPYSRGRDKWYQSDGDVGLINEPAILIKRTSSKEQARRIHAVLVDQSYVDKLGGFLAENHINLLVPKSNDPTIDLPTLLRLIRSNIVDKLFRCISGTVTVSSTELNHIPMPSHQALQTFAESTKYYTDHEDIERAAQIAYKVV